MKKPDKKDYHTDSGMHSAMRDYARSFDRPCLSVAILFYDGSLYEDTFEYAQKEIYYSTNDGEVYSVSADTAKIKNSFLDGEDEMTVRTFKETFLQWIRSGVSPDIEKIKWNH